MNSNAVHNILNIAGWALGALTAVLLYLGCTAGIDGRLDCSASTIIPASWLPVLSIITTGIFLLKSLINVGRDGVGGLFKPQPPVQNFTGGGPSGARQQPK